ncbi:MAG TPA: hypothetical protein VMO26_02070 [Vicinamibacterales bacterium]|nr:hypothetical protein [Vicinamibacterales bacterium]
MRTASFARCRPYLFYMLYAYSKNEQDDLAPTQARLLGQLVREEFK